MQWEESGFHFGRPLRWLLALLDSRVVEITLAGLRSGRETYGHRVLAVSPFSVRDASEYFEVLRDRGHVVVREKDRLTRIRQKGDELAQGIGSRVIWKQRDRKSVV